MTKKKRVELDGKEDFIKHGIDKNTLLWREEDVDYDVYGMCRFVEHRDNGKMIVEDLEDMDEELVDYSNWEIYGRLAEDKEDGRGEFVAMSCTPGIVVHCIHTKEGWKKID